MFRLSTSPNLSAPLSRLGSGLMKSVRPVADRLGMMAITSWFLTSIADTEASSLRCHCIRGGQNFRPVPAHHGSPGYGEVRSSRSSSRNRRFDSINGGMGSVITTEIYEDGSKSWE